MRGGGGEGARGEGESEGVRGEGESEGARGEGKSEGARVVDLNLYSLFYSIINISLFSMSMLYDGNG